MFTVQSNKKYCLKRISLLGVSFFMLQNSVYGMDAESEREYTEYRAMFKETFSETFDQPPMDFFQNKALTNEDLNKLNISFNSNKTHLEADNPCTERNLNKHENEASLPYKNEDRIPSHLVREFEDPTDEFPDTLLQSSLQALTDDYSEQFLSAAELSHIVLNEKLNPDYFKRLMNSNESIVFLPKALCPFPQVSAEDISKGRVEALVIETEVVVIPTEEDHTSQANIEISNRPTFAEKAAMRRENKEKKRKASPSEIRS